MRTLHRMPPQEYAAFVASLKAAHKEIDDGAIKAIYDAQYKTDCESTGIGFLRNHDALTRWDTFGPYDDRSETPFSIMEEVIP